MGMGDKVTLPPAGYSGTPLAKKLGIKAGFKILPIDAPAYYFNLFTDLPADIAVLSEPEIGIDLIHLFVKEREVFLKLLPQLRTCIKSNGIIWVSWPKKASKVLTDITEDVIRNYALSTDLVDIKVCAVDEVWSGLKLVIPVAKRN